MNRWRLTGDAFETRDLGRPARDSVVIKSRMREAFSISPEALFSLDIFDIRRRPKSKAVRRTP